MGKSKKSSASPKPLDGLNTTLAKSSTTPSSTKSTESDNNTLTDVSNNLWYRINVLIFDLRHFRDKDTSVDRLNTVMDPMYMGAPYFSAEEAALIKATVMSDGQTLQANIEATMEEKLKRRKCTELNDFRPCAAHDIAPLLERAFNVNYKKLDKSKHFQELLGRSGLELKEGQKFKGV